MWILDVKFASIYATICGALTQMFSTESWESCPNPGKNSIHLWRTGWRCCLIIHSHTSSAIFGLKMVYSRGPWFLRFRLLSAIVLKNRKMSKMYGTSVKMYIIQGSFYIFKCSFNKSAVWSNLKEWDPQPWYKLCIMRFVTMRSSRVACYFWPWTN
jgi:hypothetical protein